MDGWKRTSLGEACQFINGLWKGEVPPLIHVGVIRNTNFTKDGALDDSDIAYLDVEAKKFAKRRLQYGDLILEKSGGGPKQPVGRVVFFDKTDGDYSFSNFTAAMRVVEPDKLDPLYLHRYLHWVYVSGRTEAMQSHSTGIRNLNGDAYKAISVDYPPLPEQRRIVAILDEAFEAIATAKANTEKNLQNTRDAFLAYRTAVLSTGGDEWDERQLGAVCVLQRGLDLPSRDRKPGPYPLLSSSGLIDTHVEGPVRGPGVVTGRSGSIGSVFYVEQDFWPLNTVLYVRDFCGNHPRFVYHLLEHFDLKRFASGAGVPTLNRNIVHEEIVLVPQSLSAQEKVADSLDKLYAACQKVEKVHVKKVSALDELKKSLLHQAFTGQLTAKSTDQQLEAVA